ncbi:OmpA family protein [Flavihumibacter sp. R14]|nr:OmpA family protein [Flavihumibacter soli]
MNPNLIARMLVIAAVLVSGSSLAQNPSTIAVRKSDNTPVAVLATEEEKMEVAEAIKNVEFDFDQAEVRPEAYKNLDGLTAWLKGKDVTLKVSGFADATGPKDYNRGLSARRARAVKDYLVMNGADPARIDPVGFGETNPVAPNDSESGRQKNRRVEFGLY